MSVRWNILWAAALSLGLSGLVAAPAEAQEGDPWGEYEEEPAGDRGSSRATASGTVPEGMWAAGGLHGSTRRWAGGGGLRGEFGLPLTEINEDMRLAIALPLYTAHRRFYNQLYLVPEIQFEIDLPIDMRHKLSVVPYAGLGLGFHFFSRSWWGVGPGTPTGSRTDVTITIPIGAWARFTMDNGFMAQVMPLGFSMNIAVNSNPWDRFFASYHFFAMAGYRWD